MKKLIFLSLIFFLFGCATPYQPLGFSGGYDDTRLGDDIFLVNFRGNGYTSQSKSFDYTLLRASELLIEAGYPYFTIISDNDVSKTGLVFMGQSQTYGGSTSTGGSAVPITKPGNRLIVQGFKNKPSSGAVFDAALIKNNIRQKYSIK